MKSIKPTIHLLLDTRREKNDKSFPLKMVIYYMGVKERFKLPYSFTEINWKRIEQDTRLKDKDLKEAKLKINADIQKAHEIIDQMPRFSFREFKKRFFSDVIINSDNTSLESLYTNYINHLKNSDRISTASSYDSSLKSLSNYKANQTIHDITPDFLMGYEKYMIKNGAQYTTIGIYLRPLRKLYNDAIIAGIVNSVDYPFKEYKIPASRKTKRSLLPVQIGSIVNYVPKTEAEEKAKDFWVFSYLSNGMNMKDICNLTYGNIQGDFIVFYRAKTFNTNKGNLKAIKVPLSKMTKEVIKKWGNFNNSSKIKIFPFVKQNATAVEERTQVQTFTRCINRQLKNIAKELNLDIELSTYVARHCFATQLKRQGQNTELIGEMMGHTNKQTTENYLGSFTDDKVETIPDLLMQF